MEIYLLIAIGVLLLIIIVLIVIFRSKPDRESGQLQYKIGELQSSLTKIESNFREDFKLNREENTAIAKDNRTEINNTLKDIKSELSDTLKTIADQNHHSLKEINKTLADKVDSIISKIEENNRVNRDSLAANLKDFSFEQRNKFDDLKKEQNELTSKIAEQLEKVTNKVEMKLSALNEQSKADNKLIRDELASSFKGFQETIENKQNELVKNTENKLDHIRAAVEEKLEKTLSERLGQSFETVGKQLIEVQRGLGEMQTMAADVGGLKKVLSNVKLRGGIGEVQLAMLLEQILAPNQYESNVITVAGSNERVEFAIKLPGRNEVDSSIIYLPIDAKFPKDAYEHLIAAYENAVPDDIETATKNLESTIRKMAKDIRDKYLGPNTTDFAILFLPFESIYAEVIRRSALVDQLRYEYNITVAGPTTLLAILNSLQMGFRAMALQKRSGEVWRVLAAVKSEFEKFGGMLDKAQKNIQMGLGQLEIVSSARTRAIQRQLNNIESLPTSDTQLNTPEIKDAEVVDNEINEENETPNQLDIPFPES